MSIKINILTDFDGKAIQRARKEFGQLETASEKAQFAIRKAAVPAAAAVGVLGAALFDATKGAIADEAAQVELARSLRQTTGATDALIASNEEWITTQGQLLGITDDELRPVMSKLARATGDVTRAQKLATQAMDIATATGKPLSAVTDALTRALGGNMTALGRLAPEFREMVKEGASFDDIMAEIAGTMGGAASEAANTAEGRFKRLGVAFSETKESIGAALIPAMEAVLPLVEKFAAWAQNNPQAFMIIAGALGAIAASIMAINVAMALNPIGLIVVGVIALIAGLALAYQRFESVRTVVDFLFNALKIGIDNAINNFRTMLNIVKAVFNGIGSAWNNTFGQISFDIPNIPGLPGRGTKIQFPKIPALAEGGVVTGPTLALIGEAGPEAVIPLDRMGSMGGGDVNIYVQGADPNAVVDALRTYMFRNGSVPIKVA
jgi:cell division septum initiation protein DivIVA